MRGIAKSFVVLCVCLFAVLVLPVHSLASEVQVRSAPLSTQSAPVNGMVRVYLSSLGSPTLLNLTIQGQYTIGTTGDTLSSGAQASVSFQPATGTISLSSGGRTWNMGQSFTLRRLSSGTDNGIRIAQARESGNPYPADFTFKAVANGGTYKLYTIAHVYIEDYLYGVLPYEMGNSSNVEALKAQAVAARTYTVRMMNTRASGIYDVQDTTNDQTYRGTPSGNANCVAAVNATKGIVLMYGSNYITTYYSASNGGQTEIARSGVKYDYMTVKDDPFDFANPSSTVRKKTINANLSSYASAQFGILLKNKAVAALQKNGYAATFDNTTLGTLSSITPHTPKYASPSRLYTQMDFTFTVTTQSRSGYSVTVTQTVTCDIFNELESLFGLSIQSGATELWSVVQSGSSFEIQARRYGHGMGMSQRGAMYMGKLGYTYDLILGFYYENCTRVKKSFTSSILTPNGDEHVSVETPVEDELTDPDACYGVVHLASSTSVLGVRSSASASATLVGALSNGAKVEVVAQNNGWCYVSFGQIQGYVPSSSLTIVGTPDGSFGNSVSILGFATVTASDYVNLRQGTSTSTSAVGTAPAGAVLTVFSQSGGWARVQYNTTAAYVSTQFISSVSATYPSGNISTGSASARVTTRDGGSVNLRASASTNAQILASLAYGTEVTILSDDGAWANVDYDGVKGYIMSRYLRSDNDESEEKPEDEPIISGEQAVVATQSGSLNMRTQPSAGSQIITSIPKGTQITVTERGGDWSAIVYAGRSGYVMTSFLAFETNPSPAPPSYEYAVVVTPGGGLNLRQQPWSGSYILSSIPQRERVSIIEYGSQWCNVEWNGIIGYVMTTFLSFESSAPTPVPPAETAEYAYVTTPSGALNLRAEPSGAALVILQIPRGAKVRLHWQETEWSMIDYEGTTGYVMTKYLSFNPPSEPEVDEENTPSAQTAYVKTLSGGLNLRATPALNGQLVAIIPQNAAVTLLSYGETWSSVVYQAQAGFVMSQYLSFVQPDHGTQNQPSYAAFWVNTSSGALNVRSAASASSTVLFTLAKGTEVRLISQSGDWAYIESAGIRGYVMMTYLSSTKPVPEQYTVSDGFDLTLRVPDSAMYAYSQNMLSLWQNCSESGSVVGIVPAYEQVEIVLVGDIWCCVQYQGLQGYCKTNLLSVTNP